MRGLRLKRAWLVALCAAALALCAAAPAQGASGSDPLFVYVPTPPPPPPPIPPPVGYFNGPCGLAVDPSGNFFVSDYYHHTVDIFDSGHSYLGQLKGEDPLDGPCGLAFDSSNDLYINNYHRNVVKYGPGFSGGGTTLPLPAEDTAHHLPTGVAVDPVSGDVYVDNRTYVSVYDSTGAPVMDPTDPLRIGVDSLGDGYGIAISQFPATLGDIYVPDASDNTIKVYDPAIDKADPVAVIDGQNITPNPGFVSLRDASVAVDRVSGKVYVLDDLQPQFTEQPNAMIYVFDSTGVYLGHLKYEITDALPAGLAVDNTTGPTQGRVYVTTGNTYEAGVYAYPPGAETTQPPIPATASLSVSASGSGGGAITASSPVAIDCTSPCQTPIRSGMAVELTATPDSGSTFAGWSGGGCSGDGTCTVRMNQATSVSAEFQAAQESPSSSPSSEVPPVHAAPGTSSALPPRRHHARRHQRHRGHRHRGGRSGSKRKSR